MVAGKVLIADEAAVRAEARVRAQEVAQHVAADPVHREVVLLAAMRQDSCFAATGLDRM